MIPLRHIFVSSCKLSIIFEVLVQTSCELTASKKLAADLINNYGPRDVRPVKDPNTTTEVFFRAKPVWFSEFDERKQVLTFISLNKYEWTDEYLTWDPADYEGIKKAQFSKDQFWFPDITVMERIGTESAEVNIEDTVMTVNYNGEVVYFQQSMLSVFCKMDVRLFPYDKHECNISYLAYGYTMDEVELHYSEDLDAQENIIQKNGVWSVTNIEAKAVLVPYLCCPIPYHEVHVTIFIMRESGFYVLNIGLPTFLLSFTTLSVFLLHPESGEKISLCVNNVLALIIFQQLLSFSMPPTGDHTPVVAFYYVVVICISFLSVLTTCMTLGIYHNRGTRPFPRTLKTILLMKPKQAEKELTNGAADNVIVNEGAPHDWIRLGEIAEGGFSSTYRASRRRSSSLARLEERNKARRKLSARLSNTGNDVTGAASPGENYQHEWMEAAFKIDFFLFLVSLSSLVITTIYCLLSLIYLA